MQSRLGVHAFVEMNQKNYHAQNHKYDYRYNYSGLHDGFATFVTHSRFSANRHLRHLEFRVLKVLFINDVILHGSDADNGFFLFEG